MPKRNAAAVPPRRPAAGPPKALEICSIFLLTPQADAKLEGFSVRASLKAVGKEYQFKVMDRLVRPSSGLSQDQMLRQTKALLATVPAVPALDVFKRRLEGDEAAQAEIDGMGFWMCWSIGVIGDISRHRRIVFDHAIEVEQACIGALPAIRDHAFDRVAAFLAADPMIKPYASDEALLRLSEATSDIAALPARAACLCEFLVSQVARVDIEVGGAGSSGEGYGALLGGSSGADGAGKGRCQPGRVLVDWIKARFRVKTLEVLLTLNSESSTPADIDESTLKRWSSGAVFPSRVKLGELIQAMLDGQSATHADLEREMNQIGLQFWAAQRLDKLLKLVRQLQAADQSVANGFGWEQMMGDTTPDAWCRRRYPFWVAHWRERNLATR